MFLIADFFCMIKPGIGSRNPEMHSRDPEMRSRGPEIDSSDPEMNSRGPEIDSRNPEMCLLDPEIRSHNPGFTLISWKSDSESERQDFNIIKLARSVLLTIFR